MKVRRARRITHRVSSVTNGFVQVILPDKPPDPIELAANLDVLGIEANLLTCAYCGDGFQHWDHLFPYVKNKRPSGYLNEARNLVPACGPCNTSKSGADWRSWMLGPAKGSPARRGITDLAERVARIDNLVAINRLAPINLSALVGQDLWAAYWQRRDQIERLLFEAQTEAELIKAQILTGLKDPN